MAPQVLASCSLDGKVCLVDTERGGGLIHVWKSHRAAAGHLLVTAGDENTLLSCGDDGRVVQYDRRSQESPRRLLDWRHRWGSNMTHRWCGVGVGVHGVALNSIASCALKPHLLLLGGEDPFLWLFDRRRLTRSNPLECEPLSVFRPQDLPWERSVVTGTALSPDGRRLLGSWSGHNIFEFQADEGRPRMQMTEFFGQRRRAGCPAPEGLCQHFTEYVGHNNRRTNKEVAYLGGGGEMVASGSDCGRLFVWDARRNGALVCVAKGDTHVVNTISGHPHDLCLVTGGIDTTVKFWSPTSSVPQQLTGTVENLTRSVFSESGSLSGSEVDGTSALDEADLDSVASEDILTDDENSVDESENPATHSHNMLDGVLDNRDGSSSSPSPPGQDPGETVGVETEASVAMSGVD